MAAAGMGGMAGIGAQPNRGGPMTEEELIQQAIRESMRESG